MKISTRFYYHEDFYEAMYVTVGWYIYHGLYYDHEMTDSDICGETVI